MIFGLGNLILLPKQWKELLGYIYVFNPGYHGNADTTIKFCRPFTLYSPYQEIVSSLSNFPHWPLDYKLFNPGYHGNSHYMEKGCTESSVHVIKKSCLKEIGRPIPLYIRLLYSFG